MKNIHTTERDPSKPAEQQGVFRKFDVRRVDGGDQPGGKHHGCKYFVLDLTHDKYAPEAMRAYAAACRGTHPQLADDIEDEYGTSVHRDYLEAILADVLTSHTKLSEDAVFALAPLLASQAVSSAQVSQAAPVPRSINDELDFDPTEKRKVADMANVGNDLMDRIEALPNRYMWNNSPAEIVGDLLNEIEELKAAQQAAPAECITCHVCGSPFNRAASPDGHGCAQPVQDASEWERCEQIADIPDVDEALRGFSADPTGNSGTMLVRSILRAAQPHDAGKVIHYPDCWDTAAYPTLESAISEVTSPFKCSICTESRVDARQEAVTDVSQLCIGRILRSKDTDRMGNAIIFKISESDYGIGTLYHVRTDFGNTMEMIASEVAGEFRVSDRIDDPVQRLKDQLVRIAEALKASEPKK